MIDSTNNIAKGLEGLGLNKPEQKKSNDSLGQEEFMKLMVAQLNNQDPTKPMDNADFLSQLAQFGTVNGITELQTSFNTLTNSLQSNQALQASTLVGRSVLVPANAVNLTTGGTVDGAIEVPQSSGEVNLIVKDSSGQIVKELSLGAQAEGTTNFKWNGLNDSGNAVPAGRYILEAEAVSRDTTSALSTMVQAKVDSVTLSGAAGPLLNLAGIGSVGINEIKQVQ